MTTRLSRGLRVIAPHRPLTDAHRPSKSAAEQAAVKPRGRASQIRHVPIRDWPEHQRPREKLLRDGAAVLSASELLSIVRRMGIPGKSANDLGQALIVRFGSIQGLLSASAKQLRSVPGI